jgi:hypothetical protein
MDHVADYLRLPGEYVQELGGLTWSGTGEAVEYADGGTFVLGQQLAPFVEGFAASGRLIHLAYFLHWFHLLGHGRGGGRPPEAAILAGAFRDGGCNLRNAGALAAAVCQGVPAVSATIDPGQVCQWLKGVLHYHPFPAGDRPAEVPPWPFARFQRHVTHQIQQFALADLVHWFRHGRGPQPKAGEDLARELAAPRPRHLLEILATVTLRDRLAGAAPFVAQLVSALALPPRRLAHQELPLGGFADVTTRGHPEHLLPSQFAVEGDEFVRRFAEHELLYFRREEPHARTREVLIVLLDQGVRTWGDVRLLLTAGLVAFAKLAARRHRPFYFATTANGGAVVDPLQLTDEEFGALLEASDLTPNPGLALEKVLEGWAAEQATARPDHRTAADVVLLTHPRSLPEADVQAAARRARPELRLFALASDDQGEVSLAELRHGTPVGLSRFHVQAEPAVVAAPPAGHGPWQGGVELKADLLPLGKPRLMDFDGTGRWLLVAGGTGALYLWEVPESTFEVLPRGLVGPGTLAEVDSVLGVTDGFVVAGRVPQRHGWSPALVYYRLTDRQVMTHLLPGPCHAHRQDWFYVRECHTVVLRSPPPAGGLVGFTAYDLATAGTVQRTGQERSTEGDRPGRAVEAVRSLLVPPPRVPVFNDSDTIPATALTLHLDRDAGRLTLRNARPSWSGLVPTADGAPALRGCTLVQAWQRGGTLAAVFRQPGVGNQQVLRVFRGPPGTAVFEHRSFPREGVLALGPEGRQLAYKASGRSLKVGTLSPDGGYFLLTLDAKRGRRG